eukprot:4333735-Pyramimonas_sp.AAC.1
MGPRNAVLFWRSAGSKGCAGWRRTHAGGLTGGSGRAPYGATTRCTGWVKRREQGPCWVVADACGPCHWDLRWNPLYGTTKRCT